MKKFQAILAAACFILASFGSVGCAEKKAADKVEPKPAPTTKVTKTASQKEQKKEVVQPDAGKPAAMQPVVKKQGVTEKPKTAAPVKKKTEKKQSEKKIPAPARK